MELFERCGEREDVLEVADLVTARFTVASHYLHCSALDVLLARPEFGPYDGVEGLYHRAAMSCTRKRTAQLMARTDPAFASGLAVEALWDCETEARAAAAEVVDLSRPGVAERLEALAVDPLEDDIVRDAAAARLG
jgi:hypothetical protein